LAILVAGVGYIGAALLRQLDERADGQRIVALDNFFSTTREAVLAALPKDATLVEGDVADQAAVDAAFDALGEQARGSTVYFLAAQPSAGIAARDPATTERSNLVGARLLLEAAHECEARVVFGGSFRVYGDDLTGCLVDEETAYGRVGDLSHLSKVYVEQLARMLGVRYVSVRLGVTYGLSPIMKRSPQLMTVPNLFCMRAVAGLPLQVNEDRPMAFVHVDDAARALRSAAQMLSTTDDRWSVVNAAPEVATIGHVARTVQQLMRERGGDAQILGEAASEASFIVRTAMTSWTPKGVLETSLGEVIDYFAKAAD
jgi:UDP-glucose 4-epimerase